MSCNICNICHDDKKNLPDNIEQVKPAADKYNTEYYIEAMAFTQPAITCSKLAMEALEQGVKYVQSYQ